MTKDEVIGRLVSGSKQIEGVPEGMGAQGTGLHGKALSIESHLGAALVKKIQFSATIRNKAVHEDAFQDVPFDAWTRAKDQVLVALEAMDPAEPGSITAAPGRWQITRKGLRPDALDFGHVETDGQGFDVELSGRKTPAVFTGGLLRPDGRMFDSFSHPYDCRREVTGGCGEWTENGVGLVARSTVSFGNALKIVDVR